MTNSDDYAEQDNPNCARTHATLRFVGHDLDPDAVSRELGIRPTYSVRRGDVSRGIIRKEGAWALSTRGANDSRDLELHIRELLTQMPRKQPPIPTSASRAEIHCVWHSATGHGGPVLSAAVVRWLAERGLGLDFDFYSDADDDESPPQG